MSIDAINQKAWEPVIGLEIHAQLKTQSKIFCSDSTDFNSGDNENTSPVSLGMPGALPSLNSKVLELAVKAGLALNCRVRTDSVFSRKNYFYPDLPKGYQISQHDRPICEKGSLTFFIEGIPHTINVERAHLEEDAGKSIHLGEFTLLNFNRSGIPLLEIVSAPEIKSPKEAAEYARAMRQLLMYLDVCDGNLEEGSLRCDCNVSVRKKGEVKLGTRVEIKNINSFRFVEKALQYEIDRQIDSIEAGEKITQETRLWDPDKNRTYVMRTKEDAADYRYFPDPDIPQINLKESWIHEIQLQLPELPLQKRTRLIEKSGLSETTADQISSERELADYFDQATSSGASARTVANWILSELLGKLNESQLSVSNSPVTAENLGELVKAIESEQISGKIAKSVFTEMWSSGKPPDQIIKEQSLSQVTDESAIVKIVEAVLDRNLASVQEFNSGKTKLLGFFVGQIMKESKGQASPEIVNRVLLQSLGARK